MGRIQLFQDEELIRRFRPHPLSFMGHYLGSFGWLLAGLAGSGIALTAANVAEQFSGVIGAGAFVVLVLGGGILRKRLRHASMAYTWFGVLVGAAGTVAAVVLPSLGMFVPAACGALLWLVRLVGWELMREQREHFLTSQRLVVRAGLGHRQEESVAIDRIEAVRSQLGPLGQVFNYGDLVLGLGVSGRGKAAAENVWILAGIGNLSDIKHQVDQLVEETRLPLKERRRRAEERRLRESMRRLSAWMRKRPTQG